MAHPITIGIIFISGMFLGTGITSVFAYKDSVRAEKVITSLENLNDIYETKITSLERLVVERTQLLDTAYAKSQQFRQKLETAVATIKRLDQVDEQMEAARKQAPQQEYRS